MCVNRTIHSIHGVGVGGSVVHVGVGVGVGDVGGGRNDFLFMNVDHVKEKSDNNERRKCTHLVSEILEFTSLIVHV